MSFPNLKLHDELLKALSELEYHHPTPIQQQLIPAILQGRDVVASAYTGTGKSAAYLLPILELMHRSYQTKEHYAHYTQALILVPTKELAKQVATSAKNYGKFLPFKSVSIHGGRPIETQAGILAQGVDLIVATPGRLLELVTKDETILAGVNFFVLDEADTILDMGFTKEVFGIMALMKVKRQSILVSATLSNPLKELSKKLLVRPQLIELSPLGSKLTHIKQKLYIIENERKTEFLSFFIGSQNFKQTLVFARTKEKAKAIETSLLESGLACVSIHGDKTPGARSRALESFKTQKARILVATDIAARGLDIKDLEAVINFDIPHILSDFIHRIGRTGRAGNIGLAITISSNEELYLVHKIERLLGQKIERVVDEEHAPQRIMERTPKKTEETTPPKRVSGAFGKKPTAPSTKKRKTTKRDRYNPPSSPTAKKSQRKR